MFQPTPLTTDLILKAGFCEHGRRQLRQNVSKSGKAWRGEFCVVSECEPMWWRWNEQIGLWIAPMYEPMDYVYHGIANSPWADPKDTEEENGGTDIA